MIMKLLHTVRILAFKIEFEQNGGILSRTGGSPEFDISLVTFFLKYVLAPFFPTYITFLLKCKCGNQHLNLMKA